eukprot:Platyproteum_vivax@DN5358_c0_g2_i2.p2
MKYFLSFLFLITLNEVKGLSLSRHRVSKSAVDSGAIELPPLSVNLAGLLDVETVDRLLDEVRPYLAADGGDVEVVSVDTNEKKVYVTLKGACGNCPASTTTLHLGIERLLKETWPDISVVEVPAVQTFLSAVEGTVGETKMGCNIMGADVKVHQADGI